VIVAEEPDFADTEKPAELLRIVERFCLGRKRLNLFGKTPRKGWLTIGPSLPPTNYDKNTYESWFKSVKGKKPPKEIISIDPGKAVT
jgi:mRNA m6A methyltransferase non-catalytic subunit